MRTPGSRKLLLLALLWLAFLLRILHWLAVREQPFFAELVMDSEEYDRWAREIAAGDWLGSEPFFQAPLYPYLLGALYAVAGGRDLDLVYLLQIALAVAGGYALYRTGRRLGGEGLGLAALALAAVYGPFLFFDVQLLKESLAVTTVCFLLWAITAARAGSRGAVAWLLVGLLLGLLVLLRENALLLAPLLLPLAWSRGSGARFTLRRLGALVAGLVVVLAPVALRNARLGGGFLPTTFQGGVNFYIGNNPSADGTYRPLVPGKQVPAYERREPVRLAEEAVGRTLSAAEVSRYWLRRALVWAREHPADFIALQLRKLALFWSWYEWPDAVDYYWVRRELSPVLGPPLLEFGGATLLAVVGVWLSRRRLGEFLPVLLWIVGWTLSTVAFFLFSRYRLPVVPALLLLAAVPVRRTVEAIRDRRPLAAIALAVIWLVAFVAPHLRGYRPRMDMVQYNLGLLAERRGEEEEAAARYRLALESNPRFLLPCLNLGNQAARRGDYPRALGWYRRATVIEPRSDDAWSNLGGAYLAEGRLVAARDSLERALELNGRNLWALHNLALVFAASGETERALELNRRTLEIDPGFSAGRRLREGLEDDQGSAGT